MKIAEGDGKIFSLIKRDLINKRIAEEWGLDGLTFCKPELRRGVEYDIFISYTHGDYDVRKNRIDSLIENILMVRLGEKKGPNVFFDKKVIREYEAFQGKLIEGVDKSKVLLVLLTPNYLNSEYCYWEWENFLRQNASSKEGAFKRIIILTTFDWASIAQQIPEHWSKFLKKDQLRFVHVEKWWHSEDNTEISSLSGIISIQIKEYLLKILSNFHVIKSIPSNLPPLGTYFWGRSEEIQFLREKFNNKSGQILLAVTGEKSVGKKTLLFQFLTLFPELHKGGKFVIKYESTPLKEQLCKLFNLKNFHYSEGLNTENKFELLLKKIRSEEKEGKSTALIITNCVRVSDIIGELKKMNLPEGIDIFLTGDSSESPLKEDTAIHLNFFNKQEIRDIINSFILPDVSEQSSNELLSEISNILSVKSLNLFVNKKELHPHLDIHSFKKSLDALYDKDSYLENLGDLLAINGYRIDLKLLENLHSFFSSFPCQYLNIKYIDDIITRQFGYGEDIIYIVIDLLEEYGILSRTNNYYIIEIDREFYNKILIHYSKNDIINSSIVDYCVERSNQIILTYTLEKEWEISTLIEISKLFIERGNAYSVKLLLNTIQLNSLVNTFIDVNFIELMESALHFQPGKELSIVELMTLRLNILRLKSTSWGITKLISDTKIILSECGTPTRENAKLLALGYRSLALFYISLGNTFLAEQSLEKGLSISEDLIDDDCVVFSLRTDLIRLEIQKTFFNRPRVYYLLSMLSAEHLDVVNQIAYLDLKGEMRKVFKDFTGSESYYKEAIKLCQDTFGHYHYMLSILYNNLSCLYKEYLRHEEALVYIEKSLEINSLCFPENSFKTGEVYWNYSTVLFDHKRLEEAEYYCSKAYQVYSKLRDSTRTLIIAREIRKHFPKSAQKLGIPPESLFVSILNGLFS